MQFLRFSEEGDRGSLFFATQMTFYISSCQTSSWESSKIEEKGATQIPKEESLASGIPKLDPLEFAASDLSHSFQVSAEERSDSKK